MAARKNRRRIKKVVRGGAGAFALGLFLAGPQVGSAAADTGPDVRSPEPSGAATGAAPSSAPAGRGAARAAASPPARAGGGPRSARPVPPKEAAATARPAASLTASRPAARSATPGRVARAANSTMPYPPSPSMPMLYSPSPSNGSGDASAPPGITLTTTAPSLPNGRIAAAASPLSLMNGVSHWLSELPASPVSAWLEGAWLMVRKSFLNQAPRVTPSPQTTSSGDGTVRGRIGAFDLEGDPLTYTVVADPQYGTVEVLGDGRYAFTPGDGFVGTDSFTVVVAPQKPVLNLLDPFGDGTREVTIQIGGANEVDAKDYVVYLPGASGHIKVVKSGLFGERFTGIVTLTETTPETQWSWMDQAGHRGRISQERLLTVKWPEFHAKAAENGATLDLSIAYTDADGTGRAVMLQNISVSQDADGRYVFTGQLAPDPEIEQNAVDVYDVAGSEFKSRYEDFRKAYNIEAGQTWGFTTVDIDFTQAAVFADTYTPTSYQQAGLYALDSEANPLAAQPPGGTAAGTSLPARLLASSSVARSGVTAAIQLGKSFVVGRNDGSVQLWSDGQEQILQDAGWSSPVTYLLDYSRPLKDSAGNTVASSFTGYISGTTLTVTGLGQGSSVVVGSEITGAGVAAGTKITAFVPQTGSCSEDGSSCSGGSGGSDGGPGTYTVSIAQTVGSSVGQPLPDDSTKLLPAGVEFTQKGVNAIAPGFVVGLGNGAVQLWTASGGWTELHDSGWAAGVTSMITYGEGIVLGLGNGSVQKWNGPGSNPDQGTWKNNWTELKNDGWASGVTVMVPYKGYPSSCTGGCDGFLVGLGNGSVQQYNEATDGAGKSGWKELKDSGWNSAVRGIALSGKDAAGLPTFAVGLQNGAVEQWQWNSSTNNFTWVEIQKPNKDGWNSEITAMSQFGADFIVGLKNGAVFQRVNPATGSGSWVQLRNDGWASAVNKIVPFQSATVGNGVVVGLDNGSVQAWGGSGQNSWTELHDSGWASGIASIVPATAKVTDAGGDVVSQDGVVVGLENGALEQWSGLISGSTGQNDWTEIKGPQTNQAATVMGRDGFLKSAVDFALALNATGEAPVWGVAGSVGGTGDPLFSQAIFQKASTAAGTYLPVMSYIPASLIKKTLEDPNGLTDSTVDLSFDVNAIAYGYAYVPDGAFAKLVPGKWSLAMLVALQTGPSLTLNFSSPGTISVPDQNLFNYQYWTPGPLGFDSFAIDVGANAKLDVTLLGAEDKDSLKAYAYMVPGMLFTYNTQSKPSGVQLGFSAYPDINASDFTSLTGIKVTPTLTPYVTASYGIMVPDATPLIGGWGLFAISLGLENPVSATVCADTTAKCPTATADTGSNLSLTLDSEGYITASAGLLPGVTDKLTWDDKFKVYDVSTTFQL